MLSKKYRLQKDFDNVYTHGYKVRGDYGMLVGLRDEGLEDSLFGVVVPKKIGKAYRRNRLKRRVKGLVRELIREGFFENVCLRVMYVSFTEPEDFSVLKDELKGQMDKLVKHFAK